MADESTLAPLGERLVAQVVEFGIRGGGPLSNAVQTAEEHLITAGGDREAAVQRLIATHVRLAAATGFVTGLGGFVTLPVTVPAPRRMPPVSAGEAPRLPPEATSVSPLL